MSSMAVRLARADAETILFLTGPSAWEAIAASEHTEYALIARAGSVAKAAEMLGVARPFVGLYNVTPTPELLAAFRTYDVALRGALDAALDQFNDPDSPFTDEPTQ